MCIKQEPQYRVLPPPSSIKITIMSSLKKLPTRHLGANGPEVSAIGLGTMGTSIQTSISLKS